MANHSAYNWLIEKLDEDENVSSTRVDTNGILHISRLNGPILRLIGNPLHTFTKTDIELLADSNDIDFILHTFRDPYIFGEVFEYLESKRKVLGGFKDVFKVLQKNYNWPYLSSDAHFVKRVLEQHKKVNIVRRLDNKRYQVFRNGLGNVIIIALYDYEISVESIRDAIAKHNTFDAILKANPYGGVSTSAIELSNSLGIKIFTWQEMSQQLNHKWIARR